MKLPDLEHEKKLWGKGFVVIGVDEVGRGAFAGPLAVGGVIFEPSMSDERTNFLLSLGINDSKKLPANKRKLLSKVIQKESLAYHISTINVAEINRIGIGKATFHAMRDVVRNLYKKAPGNKTFVLIDGFYVKNIKNIGLKNQKGIVGGDGICLSIAAASIIAKVARDNHMVKISAKHPQYHFDRNKGYGTLEHRAALQKFGATRLHRTVFIKNFI